MKLWTKNL